MENMKTVMITGAGGAIGVHVMAHILTNTDWEVVVTDSFKDEHKGYFDRVTRMCKDHTEWKKRIRVFTHDLNVQFTQREINDIGHVDYIINLASRSDVQASVDDPLPFVRNNTELMLTMLEYAKATKPEVFLHFSTDEVYGSVSKDSGGHKEWDSIIPSNPYAASKAIQEALAIAWWRAYGVPLIITNTMNNFGEMQAPSKFPAMIQQKIHKDETITIHTADDGEIGSRYYIHSRNAADAVLFILKNVKPTFHEFAKLDKPVRLHIVGDKQINNLELVELIGKLMGKKPKVKMDNFHKGNPGHDLHYGLNGDKLASLGWKSPIPFEDSLKSTIDWQVDNPEWNI